MKGKNIDPKIYEAIKIIEKCFGGIQVAVISENMYMLPKGDNCPDGTLGVEIDICGIRTLMTRESIAEPIIAGGQEIAEQYTLNVLKPHLDKIQNSINYQIIKNRN